MKEVNFSELIGHKILSVEELSESGYTWQVNFICENGVKFEMFHEQDCCEFVRLEDVAGGELLDLHGQSVLDAYSTSEEAEEALESGTWTFYTIRTMKGTLTLRWLGESNGYYSESVSFYKRQLAA